MRLAIAIKRQIAIALPSKRHLHLIVKNQAFYIIKLPILTARLGHQGNWMKRQYEETQNSNRQYLQDSSGLAGKAMPLILLSLQILLILSTAAFGLFFMRLPCREPHALK